MARIFSNPSCPTPTARAGSIAELSVQQRLMELPEDYSIIPNITICDKNGSRALTECDTVVITPLGAVCVVEVKSGNLNTDENGDFVRRYADQTTTSNISVQIDQQRQLLQSRLAQFKNILFEHFLALPNGVFQAESSTLNNYSGRLFDSNTIAQLPERIRALNQAAASSGRTCDKAALESFFLNNYTYRMSVAAVCDTLEQAARSQTSGLAAWVPRITSPLPFISVTAPAGAGKTELAVRLIEQAHRDSKRCAYFTFTRNGVESLARRGLVHKAAYAGTWHELAIESQCPEANLASCDSTDRQIIFESASNRLADDLSKGRFTWDVIIIDDAQDFQVEWIEALTGALSATGHMYVLSDPYSQVFSRAPSIPLDEAQTIFVRSQETVRIPRVRAEEMKALRIVTPDFVSISPYEGDSTFIPAPYTGPDSLHKATRDAVEKYLELGFRADQIAVLSWHGLETSEILRHAKLGHRLLKKPTDRFDSNNNRIFTEGEILCDTLLRFRGLGAPCVIVTEMDFEEVNDRVRNLLYHAMTRSSVALAFVMSERAFNALNRHIGSLS